MNSLEAIVPIVNHRLVLEDAGLPMHTERAQVIVLWDNRQTIDRRVSSPAPAGMGIKEGDILSASSEGNWMNANLTNAGLPAHAAERMRAVFAAHPQIERVILFGSRAKGNAKRGSDVDLAVFGACVDRDLGKVAWELDDLLLPWEIDLVPFDSITNPDLRDHIARVGQTFYAAPELAA